MLSALDLLYAVLALAIIAITVMLVVIGLQVMQVLRDMQRIAETVEGLGVMVEDIAKVLLPDFRRAAGRLGKMESKLGTYLEKKVDKLIK